MINKKGVVDQHYYPYEAGGVTGLKCRECDDLFTFPLKVLPLTLRRFSEGLWAHARIHELAKAHGNTQN